jgi:hypothetical protein
MIALTADVANPQHVVGVAVQRRVPLGLEGRQVRTARAHVIEQHDPEIAG